jgi:hypothetical protein
MSGGLEAFHGWSLCGPPWRIARPVRVGDCDGGAGASISAASACRSSRAVNCLPCSSSSPFLKGTALRQVDMGAILGRFFKVPVLAPAFALSLAMVVASSLISGTACCTRFLNSSC